MKKKHIRVALVSIISVVIVLIGGLLVLRYYVPQRDDIVYSENLNKKDLDSVISDYIKNNYFNVGNVSLIEKHEAHKIYGIDEMFGLKYVYIETVFQVGTTGGANPLVIVVKEDSSGMYSIVNHKETLDSNPLWSKIVFPNKYLRKMYSPETRKELRQKINS